MSKRDRTILFFTCVGLFLLVAPVTVLYSQGHRLDLESRRLVKVGGLFFKVAPKEVEIYLDHKSFKKTDFFFGSTLVENLLPQQYRVKITKEGYQDWNKTLAVQASQVTEAKNIVLIPRDLGFETIGSDISQQLFSEDGTRVIWQEKIKDTEIGKTTEETKETWALKLYDLKTGLKSHLTTEQAIAKKMKLAEGRIKPLDLNWSPDGKRVLLRIGVGNKPPEQEKEKYLVLELEENPPRISVLNFLDEQTQGVSFHPQDSRKLFFLKKEATPTAQAPKSDQNKGLAVEPLELALFEVSIEGESLRSILKGVVNYQISGREIVWLSEEGFLQRADFNGNSRRLLFQPLEESDWEIRVLNSEIVLKKNGEVFRLKDSQQLEKIAGNVTDLELAPDNKKIAFWNGSEVWLYYLLQEEGQPQKEKGEKVFLTRFSSSIGKVFWWTSHYLILNVGEEIKIVEVDDRDQIQIWTLANFKNPEIFFNFWDRKLYILSQGNLFGSKKMF